MNIDFEQLNKDQRKVFIALPCGELARYSDFEANFDRVVCPPNTIRQRLFGIYIANLQNQLARMFLQTDYEWFWLANDDQVYPADTLLRLLAHNKDVVVPLCLEKKAPHCPLVYEQGKNGLHPWRYLRKGERGLVLAGASGGGGMLIHRRVFEAIPDPWWEVTTRKTEDGVYEQSSEDFDFCDKIYQAGFKIWADLDVSVVHIAHYGVRAVRNENTGEWYTHLIRGDEQVVIPPATPPPSSIIVPDTVFNFKDRSFVER